MTRVPSAPPRSRGYRRVMLGSASLAILVVVVAASASAAHGVPQRMTVAANAPAGVAGQLTAVTAVPGSSDVWAVGAANGDTHYFELRRHDGHWQRINSPGLGGAFGGLHAVAAASAKNVWVGGAKQKPHSIIATPAIWKWSGGKFVAAKLPALFTGADYVAAMSASSASNVWAVGLISPVSDNGFEALQWNGATWTAVATPEEFTAVSTSGAKNAWAVGTDEGLSTGLFHWNGAVWTADGKVPAGVTLQGIATTSATLAYTVGYKSSGRPVILRFNGKSWSSSPLAKGTADSSSLFSVTLKGKSAWAVGNGVILHSSGGPWKREKPGEGVVNAVSASTATRAYAVGFSQVGRSVRTLVDVYNGHGWKGAPS